jgi:hypothetical protein
MKLVGSFDSWFVTEKRLVIFHKQQTMCNKLQRSSFFQLGHDKCWSVGTELRQLKMFEKEFSSSIEMEEMMTDNLKRRHFVIDADVEVRERGEREVREREERERGRERPKWKK